MATGDTLCFFSPIANEPPASAFATLDFRNAHPILNYDASTNWSAVWTGILARNYGGGGLSVNVIWCAATATTGNCVWNAQVERIEDEGTDIDADSFATAQAATGAAPATSGMAQYTTIAFTAGAQMDSLAAGEMFRLKVTRDAANGSDTMAGNAQVLGVEIRET